MPLCRTKLFGGLLVLGEHVLAAHPENIVHCVPDQDQVREGFGWIWRITRIRWIRRTLSCQTGLGEVLSLDPGNSAKIIADYINIWGWLDHFLINGHLYLSWLTDYWVGAYSSSSLCSPPCTRPCPRRRQWSCSGLCGKAPSHLRRNILICISNFTN